MGLRNYAAVEYPRLVHAKSVSSLAKFAIIVVGGVINSTRGALEEKQDPHKSRTGVKKAGNYCCMCTSQKEN